MLALLVVVVLALGALVALNRSATADGLQFSVGVTGPANPVPTNSTAPFTVTVNCRADAGCAGSTLSFDRPTGPDGTPLAGTMLVSLAAGANPGIRYTLSGAAGDTPVLTFTRFDNQISQVFQVSWLTTDAAVIPGDYTLNWRAQLPSTSYDVSGTAQATVTGTPVLRLTKTANTGSNLFNGALRTFTLDWGRAKGTQGTSGATTVLYDQLPSNYVFKGFNNYGVGTDNYFRSLNGTTVSMTTENGDAVYEYDAANHRIVIRITRNVDKYIAARNNGRARISYDVQVNGGTGAAELAENTKLTNTVRAEGTT